MIDILADARKWIDTPGRLACPTDITHGEECHRWHLACLVSRLADEVEKLREKRKPVAWCVQAAASTMVIAGTHEIVNRAVLIQCNDETEARTLSTVYGHKRLAIVEPE